MSSSVGERVGFLSRLLCMVVIMGVFASTLPFRATCSVVPICTLYGVFTEVCDPMQ